MDLAYDHIQEQALAPENEAEKQEKKPESTLNSDFQEAYKAISSSPWGARLGGFFGNVVKQQGQQELTAVGEEATKGFTDLRSSIISRTRALSTAQAPVASDEADKEKKGEASGAKEISTEEALKESEGVLARLRSEAAKRLKEIEKAEDAADEALLKFGTNLRNFLRDALHVIHSSQDSFTKDPVSEEYEPWKKTFNVDSKTDDISKDLESFTELRSSMEKLVPDTVAYGDFWTRYYFLRHSIETAEARRRDLLKGAAASTEEEVGWDEDSEDESSPKVVKPKSEIARPASTESSTTLHPATQAQDPTLLKPEESRRSHDEKSQADSDGSYDVVGAASGAPSRAPGSPKDSRKGDDSEEEDWE
ncbi:putative BSD domain-containing protein C22A12.14c [Leptodontidium sp. MPI-SDFR-AT-0119]|nr:putative BSD domain-containing protein C22A12.14c [Leptodontidium sp. MPI-SDFR-AT-0119]